jgi:hypothetical protein
LFPDSTPDAAVTRPDRRSVEQVVDLRDRDRLMPQTVRIVVDGLDQLRPAGRPGMLGSRWAAMIRSLASSCP